MSKYCYCGKKNELSAKFCNSCGKSFSSLESAISSIPSAPVVPFAPPNSSLPVAPKKILATKPRRPDDDEDDENDLDDDYDHSSGPETIPDIKGLEIEIQGNSKANDVTLGNLVELGITTGPTKAFTNRANNKSTITSAKETKKIHKTTLEEFQREAGSIRDRKK